MNPPLPETIDAVYPCDVKDGTHRIVVVGSQTHDFRTPGVAEHAIALETLAPAQAQRFQRRLVHACIRAHVQATPLQPHQLQVAIIGAGATGVEIAAELRKATRTLVSYGLERVDPERDIRLHLIEAGPRMLSIWPGAPAFRRSWWSGRPASRRRPSLPAWPTWKPTA